MIVVYCPKSILSPDGNSIPFASLLNGKPFTLRPEITAPLYDIFFKKFYTYTFQLTPTLIQRRLRTGYYRTLRLVA